MTAAYVKITLLQIPQSTWVCEGKEFDKIVK